MMAIVGRGLGFVRALFDHIRELFVVSIRFSRNRPYAAALIGATFLVGGYLLISAGGAPVAPTTSARVRPVELVSVYDLARSLEPLPVVGTVRSATEATVLIEAPGRVTAVRKALGDRVYQGEVVAELENASQRAAVLQAEGSLQAAQAAYAKISGGTREEQRAILETSLASAESGVSSSLQSALTTLRSANAAIEDAIRRKTDPLFTNPTVSVREYNILTSDAGLAVTIENTRGSLQALLERLRTEANTLTAGSDLLSALDKTVTDLRTTQEYLDDIVRSLAGAIPTTDVPESTLATYRTDAAAGQAAVSAAVSSVTAAKEALVGKIAARDIARKNLEQGIVGGQKEDVAAAEAAVTQARAGLLSAQAQLGKTIVRAPFSGAINALPLDLGEYVQIGSPAVTIANNSLLEVRAAVTQQDAVFVSTGSIVRVEGKYDASVASVSPGLDPRTKKIEVRLALTDPRAELTNGQSVRIEIPRARRTVEPGASVNIPLSALKFTPEGPAVFTVEADGTLRAHSVEPGTIFGETIEIRSGLPAGADIVKDARGLRAGDRVTVSS